MRTLLLSFLSFIVVFSGCSTIHVDTDYDPQYPFQTLKSYTIKNDDPKLIDTLTSERIESALNATLKLKGYNSEASDTDMRVSYYLTTQTITHTESNVQFVSGIGRYRRLGVGMSIPMESTRTFEEGKLIVDVIDPKTERLIWRGIGQDTLKTFSTPEKKTAYIHQAINDILKKFPPKH